MIRVPSVSKKILIPTALALSCCGLVLAIVFFLLQLVPSWRHTTVATVPDTNLFQAVFLTNGQIYFGHLQGAMNDYPKLTTVYYIQLNETGSGETAQKKATGKLVRLGDVETHGPKNEMMINKEHILFWENLRPDSYVATKILSLERSK